ncbi:unnamed protein product [Lasius platythorax]|uniref:Uncharacterized protein n=1 Tax=Lasius platythorax TaxID=488582 RepID=A0AAV2NW59_9HYME
MIFARLLTVTSINIPFARHCHHIQNVRRARLPFAQMKQQRSLGNDHACRSTRITIDRLPTKSQGEGVNRSNEITEDLCTPGTQSIPPPTRMGRQTNGRASKEALEIPLLEGSIPAGWLAQGVPLQFIARPI